jgi:hypothetical protein
MIDVFDDLVLALAGWPHWTASRLAARLL